ncbi:MAG: hypothetical protein IPL26_17415 [Leptospiraceae bacterium]|nr:hypothetical protein [Leptospiraceae bacterium]
MNSIRFFLKSKLFFILILLLNCISFERGIKSNLFYSSVNIAVYKLDSSPIPLSNSNTINKILLDEKLIKNIFFSIRKEKSILPSLVKDNLWDSEIIEELTIVVMDMTKSENLHKTFFVVIKTEDSLSPFSRIFRNTFYFNRDGNILQFVFGEINNNINFGTQYSFQDWSNPSFFSIRCKNEKEVTFSGKLEKSFEFKEDSNCADNSKISQKSSNSKLDNLINYRWVLVNLENAFGLLNATPSISIPKEGSRDREKRLGELLRLFKKGLISRDDYELKKAEILGEL